MAVSLIGAVNCKLLFVLSVALQMSFQLLWCVLAKITSRVFSVN